MRVAGFRDLGVSKNWDALFWGPDNKDPTVQGPILGSPIFGSRHLLTSILTH